MLICFVAAHVVACPPAEAGSGQQQSVDNVIVEETFQGELGDGWEWIRENPDQWRLRDGGLEIRVVPGLAESVVNALVRQMPDRNHGVFAIEVDVTNLSEPKQQYEQAGLTLYQDGKPVFKFVKELVDGDLVMIPGRKPMKNSSVQLRLVVSANSYSAQYRSDKSAEFQIAAEGELPPANRDQISLQCYHGPTDEERWIRFDNFRIVRVDR